jgi:hypothetical protein
VKVLERIRDALTSGGRSPAERESPWAHPQTTPEPRDVGDLELSGPTGAPTQGVRRVRESDDEPQPERRRRASNG